MLYEASRLSARQDVNIMHYHLGSKEIQGQSGTLASSESYHYSAARVHSQIFGCCFFHPPWHSGSRR